MEKVCEWCGKTYTTRAKGRKYCSQKCSNESKVGRPIKPRKKKQIINSKRVSLIDDKLKQTHGNYAAQQMAETIKMFAKVEAS